jgi:hypothetical protein
VNYDTLEMERELALVRAEIERLERHGKLTPEGVADATVLLKLLEKKAETLEAEIEWREHHGPYKKANGLEYDHDLEEEVREGKDQAPDWQKAYDVVTARIAGRMAAWKAEMAENEEAERGSAVNSAIVWKGDEADLAVKFVEELQAGKLPLCRDYREAFRMCAPHYVIQTEGGDLKPINIKSFITNYENNRKPRK